MPSSLTLELTESVMMQDMEVSLLRLNALRALGVKLAIDDFGTGYSSLNYLRQLPVDILKIDRSFLADPNPEVAELTDAIVQLARIFKLKAVAEGIESPGRSRGCRASAASSARASTSPSRSSARRSWRWPSHSRGCAPGCSERPRRRRGRRRACVAGLL